MPITIDLAAHLGLMSIPSAFTGLCFWLIQNSIKQRDKQREKQEESHKK